MSKKKAASGQLSLFDMIDVVELPEEPEPVQVDEDLTTLPEQFIPVPEYPHMPQYFVKSVSWADGDTSPDALERLSHVCLDDVSVFKDTNMDVYKYVSITTAIIGTKVWVAYQFKEKLVRYNHHPSNKDED